MEIFELFIKDSEVTVRDTIQVNDGKRHEIVYIHSVSCQSDGTVCLKGSGILLE